MQSRYVLKIQDSCTQAETDHSIFLGDMRVVSLLQLKSTLRLLLECAKTTHDALFSALGMVFGAPYSVFAPD